MADRKDKSSVTDLTTDQLDAQIAQAKGQLATFRMEQKLHKLKDLKATRKKRREIARFLTEKRIRQLRGKNA